jgi:anti-sigma factor RsiW
MNGNHESVLSGHMSSYLPDYVADRLPPVRRIVVQAHLRGCPACQREREEWQTLARAVRSVDAGAMSPTPFARAWSDLRARLPAGSPANLLSSPEEEDLSDHGNHDKSVQLTFDAEAVSTPDAPGTTHTRRTGHTTIRQTLMVAAMIALVISGFAVVFSRLGDARSSRGHPNAQNTIAEVGGGGIAHCARWLC